MPIYAYRCEACGFAKDALQKMSDAPLTVCPSCGKSTFKKQLTAAGFQLKGSGWYVTDFRSGSGGKSAPAANTTESNTTDSKTAESSATESKSTATGTSDSSASAASGTTGSTDKPSTS
jgi:putative FmdB family regulatory protein